MKNYEVMYYPYNNEYNKYIEISKNILHECGCNISPLCSFKESFKAKADVVILNWYDSLDERQPLVKIVLNIIVKSLKLCVLSCKGTVVINTFHNKLPHNAKHKWLSIMFTKIIMKLSRYVIILSKSSKDYLKPYLNEKEIDRKTRYIPHPNYIGVYTNNNLVINNKSACFKVVFVGQIRRYKNIEIIIECAKNLSEYNIKFDVYGLCNDDDYKMELLDLVHNYNNFELHFGFIPDEEISEKILQSDIVLLPYDLESSMNSGTVMLAFSNGVQVVCPSICTIDEYELAKKYAYTYCSCEEHIANVKKKIIAAYNDWISDKASFYSIGKRLMNEVAVKNSNEVVAGCYKEMLDEINY